MRQDLAVSRLEQTDARLPGSEDYRVKPPPYDQIGTVRSRGEGYEVTWPKFGGAWLERRRVSHWRRPTLPEDLAGLGAGVDDDGRPQAIGLGHGAEGSAG